MADKQAKLMAALKKKADDAEAPPPPLADSKPTAQMGKMQFKNSLRGGVTWEQIVEKLDANTKHDFATCSETLNKMFGNVLGNPTEPKFRKINQSNANFVAKVFSAKGAPELFTLVGFKEEAGGFLVLPESADLAPLQRAIDELARLAAAREEREDKKRKADAAAAAAARAERAQKAAADPSKYDEAVAAANSSAMADEDEVMISALEGYFGDHPELATGPRPFDTFDIERQVAGPGGTVVASIAASVGTTYVDFLATMKRSEGGAWSVNKIVPA